jgi:integrase
LRERLQRRRKSFRRSTGWRRSLAKQKSARTRRAYALDVRHFMATLSLLETSELRRVDHRAVIAWEGAMREAERAAPSTIRRRLSALSSRFKHLVRHGHAEKNPVREIERPVINRDEGTTAALSKAQARKLLDAPEIERKTRRPWYACVASTARGMKRCPHEVPTHLCYSGRRVAFRRSRNADDEDVGAPRRHAVRGLGQLSGVSRPRHPHPSGHARGCLAYSPGTGAYGQAGWLS